MDTFKIMLILTSAGMVARIEYEDLKFREENGKVKAVFMGSYYFYLERKDLEGVARFRVEGDALLFDCPDKRANNKFSLLLEKGFQGLVHMVRGKPALYVHRNTGIPLMGSNEFGLVDRGSNIIEVKPLTGCNLSCVFCSVSEGINDKMDIVVEKDYLVEEFEKLASIKRHGVEANIGPQGEPLLYPKLVELIRGLKRIKNVEVVSINTNGVTLHPKLIDRLVEAGLDRINLSIHTLDKEKAERLMNGSYPLDNILSMIKYCEGKIDVLLAPVLIPGHNEEDIDDVIRLSKTIKNRKWPGIGIQNYLNYKGGRNIAKEKPWDEFYDYLREKEREHGVKLIVDENVFGIYKDKTLEKPYRKGQVIKAEIKANGRLENECLCAAKERTITVTNCAKKKGMITIRLLRDKHNIFIGIPA